VMNPVVAAAWRISWKAVSSRIMYICLSEASVQQES